MALQLAARLSCSASAAAHPIRSLFWCCRSSARRGCYRPSFTFTGTIHSVTVDVSGEPIRDEGAEARRMMAQQ
jgi:hypothetical protein